MRNRSILLATAAVLAVILSPSPASAVVKAIWGPAVQNGQSQFPVYQDLGVDIWQTQLSWAAIAKKQPAHPQDPNDPAYKWPAATDAAVADAASHGISVGMMIISSPGWATPSGQPGNVPPKSPKEYADFAVAAAKHYGGVHLWMVWGEPIRTSNWLLHPTAVINYFSKGSYRPLQPFNRQQRKDTHAYARLVDATYGALKKLDRRNKIVGGMTTTSGEVDPVNWIKNLKLPNGKPPRMDFYGHNPFSTRRPNLRRKQITPGTLDFSDLDTLTGLIDKYLARGGRNRGLKIFISEYNIQTDSAGYEFSYWVSRPLAASWLQSAIDIVKHDKRIYDIAWQRLYDMPVRADRQDRGSQTGLLDLNGAPKPDYTVFKNG